MPIEVYIYKYTQQNDTQLRSLPQASVICQEGSWDFAHGKLKHRTILLLWTVSGTANHNMFHLILRKGIRTYNLKKKVTNCWFLPHGLGWNILNITWFWLFGLPYDGGGSAWIWPGQKSSHQSTKQILHNLSCYSLFSKVVRCTIPPTEGLIHPRD